MTDQPPDGTRWMRYVWLVYLIALFFQPAFDPAASLIDWAVAIGLIAVSCRSTSRAIGRPTTGNCCSSSGRWPRSASSGR